MAITTKRRARSVKGNTYLHYLWTMCSTIIFSLLGAYFTAVDFSLWSSTLYAHLSQGARFGQTICLDLINRPFLPTIIHEVGTGSYAALYATVTMAISSFLTIFSVSLFYASPVETEVQATLHTTNVLTKDSFHYQAADGTLIASLILASNVSYARFTHEDLVFPGLELPT